MGKADYNDLKNKFENGEIERKKLQQQLEEFIKKFESSKASTPKEFEEEKFAMEKNSRNCKKKTTL